MKTLIKIVSLLIITACEPNIQQGQKEKFSKTEVNDELAYDSLLALKAGADDYGMRPYVLAYLKRGPNRNITKEESTRLQRAHLDNIKEMAKLGKLVIAGPFLDDGDIRGIYIFAVKSIEEAETLTKTDPAIVAGSLVMELHPWYGPASLILSGDIQKKITKTGI